MFAVSGFLCLSITHVAASKVQCSAGQQCHGAVSPSMLQTRSHESHGAKATAEINVLAGKPAIATICCSYTGCPAKATNGNLNDYTIGDNCGNTQELIFDLGSTKSPSKLTYVHCANPGYSNGAVNQFALYASDSFSGPWNQVVAGNLPEDSGNSMKGTKRDFDLLEGSSGRYWKWNALTNHGNGAYIWTCEIELYEAPTPAPTIPTPAPTAPTPAPTAATRSPTAAPTPAPPAPTPAPTTLPPTQSPAPREASTGGKEKDTSSLKDLATV